MAQKLGPQKQAHKLLLLTLAVYANADGYCFPSQRTLAEECDLCRQTVNGHLKWLEEHGYLVSRPRVDWSGRSTSKEYVLPFRDGLTPAHDVEARRDERDADLCRNRLPQTQAHDHRVKAVEVT